MLDYRFIKYLPYFSLVLAALFWSGNFVLGRGVNGVIPPFALSFWRWAVALLVLAPFSAPHFWRQRRLLRRYASLIVVQGILGVTGFNTILYLAMQSTTAINAVLVNSITPLLIALCSWFFYKERLSVRQITGILLSFAGVLLILAKGEIVHLFAISFNRGDLLVLVAALDWALYSVSLRRLPKELNPLAFLFAINLVGLVGLAFLYAFESQTGSVMPVTLNSVLVVGYVALCASVLAFLCWNYAVRQIGANGVAPFVHLMPLFSSILAIFFLGEQFAWHQIKGALLIFGGIVLASYRVGQPLLRHPNKQ